jgi:phosphatidylserine/phosphatidylglycerophosphate/cardiolipin synthase-like enzyme
MADSPLTLDPGRNCWRLATAHQATVIVDADAYFARAREAMMQAEHQILLIGWDFDARIRLVHEPEDGAPTAIGALIDWLVRHKPHLHVHILRWDTGAIKSLFQPTTMATIARWWRHPRIHLKLDHAHPPAGSHHQKIVIVDDRIAFCGGIDMTVDRWDTREHLDDQPLRLEPNGKPYGPWHDVTTALSGQAAAALGDLGRERWHRAGGHRIMAPPAADPAWLDGLPVQFTEVELAISRTIPELGDEPGVHEIEALYVDLIRSAKRFVYAESQYFASRIVAEAIARRLEEPDGPEFVILNPVTAEGWLEPIAMDSARALIVEALQRADKHGRFRLYHPMTSGGQPIYVHAKVVVIDDAVLRIGSSNFNNRSLRLDSECDVTIDARRSGNEDEFETIAAVRDDLIAEHCGTDAKAVARAIATHGSLVRAIESLQSANGRTLAPFELPDMSSATEWLAENQILDPEGPGAMFEPLGKRRGLVSRIKRRLKRTRPSYPVFARKGG